MAMGISNFTLTKIFNKLYDDVINSKVERIITVSENSYVFSLFKNGKCYDLLLSLDPSLPILVKSNNAKTYVSNPSSYCSNLLKKYFDHGTITELKKIDNDRIITFVIKKWTPSYQLIESRLIFELFPLSPNIIVTDMNYQILDAFKRSESLDSKHPIYKGLKYTFPQNTDKYFDINTPLDQLKGKINKSEYRYLESLSNEEYKLNLSSMINDDKLYIFKNDVSSIKINSNSKLVNIEELFLLIKDKKIYENKENKYAHIFKLVEQKIKSLNKKIKNLSLDQERFVNGDLYLTKGNLLYTAQNLYNKGDKFIVIDGINIDLDPRLSLNENAQKYFKLYKKSKTGIEQVKIQQKKALDELSYFLEIENQIKFADSNDMQQIILDLSENHYLKATKNQKTNKNKPSNKKYSPHFIKLNNGTKIGYGLSSYQNEELTFSLASSNDYYFHIKDFHGPHVIIFSSSPSEEEIHIASEIAIYFANKSASEVQYTQKKYLKKVPGQRGKVILKQYSQIVINEIRESTIKLLSVD